MIVDELHGLSNDELWAVLGELRAKRDEVLKQVEDAYDKPMDVVQKELDRRERALCNRLWRVQ